MIEPKAGGEPIPVLSVYQTDAIYYGDDLIDYVAHEFGQGQRRLVVKHAVQRVDFWSDLVEGIDL